MVTRILGSTNEIQITLQKPSEERLERIVKIKDAAHRVLTSTPVKLVVAALIFACVQHLVIDKFFPPNKEISILRMVAIIAASGLITDVLKIELIKEIFFNAKERSWGVLHNLV
jgi:hypothetical protein